MAQAHKIPFIDLKYATQTLDGFGLADDGLHLNRHQRGLHSNGGRPYGYNVRNLIALDALIVFAVRGTWETPATIAQGTGT